MTYVRLSQVIEASTRRDARGRCPSHGKQMPLTPLALRIG